MKLIDVTCSKCGATLHINTDDEVIKCEYCGNEFILDDVNNVNLNTSNADEIGYKFEKGRLKAREEYLSENNKIDKNNNSEINENNSTEIQNSSRSHKLTFLKIIIWVLFFPLMIIYKIIKSDRLDFESKVIILVISGGAIIYILSGGRLWS